MNSHLIIGVNKINACISKTLLYRVLDNAKQRCKNKNNPEYKRYGIRGIKVCEEWDKSYKKFYDLAIKNGYKKGLQLDRINNNGDYCPENCQWITNKENCSIGKTRTFSTNTSGYRGVSWYQRDLKWKSTITVDGKQIHIGYYKNREDALNARINKEIELFGKQLSNLKED